AGVLTGLPAQVGARKPQVDRIVAAAAENAKTFQASGAPPPMPFGGGPGGPGGPVMIVARPGGAAGGPMSGPGGGGPQISDADRQKMQQAFQQALGGRDISKMSPEERQKLAEELRQKMGAMAGAVGAGRTGGGGARGPGGGTSGGGAMGGRAAGGAMGVGGAMGGGGGTIVMRAPAGGAGSGGPGPDIASLSLRQATAQQFTAAERE